LLSEDGRLRNGKNIGDNGRGYLEVFMQPGEKLNLTRTIRSAKTGMLLPKEGTLVSMTENLGRTLLLVAFEGGQHEYVFEYEVELKDCNASRQKHSAVGNAHQVN
jgi:hypothetical protein